MEKIWKRFQPVKQYHWEGWFVKLLENGVGRVIYAKAKASYTRLIICSINKFDAWNKTLSKKAVCANA